MSGTTPTVDATADVIIAELRAADETSEPLEDRVDAAVRRHQPLGSDLERTALEDAVTARLGGLDRLEPLLVDPTVDEVLVGNGTVWAERSGAVRAVGRIDDATTLRVIERVLAPLGRRLDRTSPIVDARLPDGSRVCAVVPPVAVDGPALSIRRFSASPRSIDDFLPATEPDAGEMRELCSAIVRRRCNVIVSGATSSGKTSLLAALLDLAAPTDRIVLMEDTAELPCRSPHLVRLEARPATNDGPPPVSLDSLVRTALRLRPDRIVVGEARGDESLALLNAMNTGHDGSFSTLHANSAADAVLRLESLIVRAAPRWPLDAVRTTLARSVDVIVHVARRGPRREVVEVAELATPEGESGSSAVLVRPIGHAASLSRGRR